jgi:hypothetical protein
MIQEDLKGKKFKVLKSQQKWHQVEELFPELEGVCTRRPYGGMQINAEKTFIAG